MRPILKAVIFSLIVMFVAISITMIVSRCYSSSPLAGAITMPARIIVLYIMVWIFYARSFKQVPGFLGFKQPFLRPFLFGVILSIPIGLTTILLLLIKNIPISLSVQSVFPGIFIVFIGPGLFEEGLFRGLLFKQLSEKMRWWNAALFTGILFGLVHLMRIVTGAPIIRAASQTLIAFSVSFLFGYIFWKIKWNLWACVSLHTLVDFYPTCLIAREHLQQHMSAFYMYSIAGFILMVIFAIIIFRKERIMPFFMR
jgi:membrane protease YdiL (CAAX protease family)